jgi:DNA-binding GntR family transcriptional regulator
MSTGWYATYNDFGATWGKAIGAVGIAIYQSLASRAWDGQCFPSYQTIADDTGVSRPTAIKYIKKLQKAGLIEVQPRHNRRGDPSSNLYTLSHLPSLKKPAEAPVKTVTPLAITDTSNLSEAEIAELARKSHFVSRPQKKPVAQPTAVVASDEQYSEAETTVPSQTALTQSQTVASTPATPSVQKQSLNFGLLTDEKDQINALHLLKGVPNKQEVLDELNKAIREKRIQTTAIQYLAGLVKKVMQGQFVPSANRKSEDELLVEKKQLAAERDKAAKQAIAACPICNSHGYLVFTETDSLHFKSAICSHNQKSKDFTEKLLARERKGEIVTYFGKGEDDPDKIDRAAAIKAIHDAMSLLSDTQQQRPAGTQPAHSAKTVATPQMTATTPSESIAEPVTTAEPATNSVATVEAPQQNQTDATTEPPPSTGHSFKSIGEAIESALEKRGSLDSSSSPATAPAAPTDREQQQPPERESTASSPATAPAASIYGEQQQPPAESAASSSSPATTPAAPTDREQQQPPEPTPEELAEMEQEIAEIAEVAAQIVVAQELLPESEVFFPTTLTAAEEDERQVKLRLENIRNEIAQMYDNGVIAIDYSTIHYLKLQIVVKLARARQLVNNVSMGERSKKLANQHLAAIALDYRRIQTIKLTRKYLEIVEKIIEMLRRTKLSEQLANAIQERNILKKNLAKQQAIENSWKDKPDDSPEDIANNRRRNIEVGRNRAAAAIEDEHPELRGNCLAVDELLPKELKLTPAQVKSIKEYEAKQKVLKAQNAQIKKDDSRD